MKIRHATIRDLTAILQIIGQAQVFLHGLGIDQWQNGYPDCAVFETDIQNHRCFLATDQNTVLGLFVLSFEPEDCYQDITGGQWLTSGEPYAVLHRMAVGDHARGRGVAGGMLRRAEALCDKRHIRAIRADTHRGNIPMQCFLEKNGFRRCGLVDLGEDYPGDSIRVAYEKTLPG